MTCMSSIAPTTGGGAPTAATPVPAILEQPLAMPGDVGGVSGGGGGAAGAPDLTAALQQLWGAIGALKGALEGAAGVSGGGGSSTGCGCGQAQAVEGAGAMGAPTAPDGSLPDTPPPAPAPAAEAKPDKAPAGYKLKHPLEGAKKTSDFGEVSSIRNNRPHGGVDYAKGMGSQITAPAPGKVTEVKFGVKGNTGGSGYGNYITIDHGNGWFTRYAHLSGTAGADVKVGDVVGAGDKIAKVGSTGNSTGPHLHFEIFKGDPNKGGKRQDPAPFMSGAKTF